MYLLKHFKNEIFGLDGLKPELEIIEPVFVELQTKPKLNLNPNRFKPVKTGFFQSGSEPYSTASCYRVQLSKFLFDQSVKSRVIATVRLPPHAAVIDLERIRNSLNSNEFNLPAFVGKVNK